MIRYLTLIEILELHRRILEQSGGALGIRDLGLLASAITQPRMTFGGEDLYPSLLEKAAVLGFSLILNHPFVDGNKRSGAYAFVWFLQQAKILVFIVYKYQFFHPEGSTDNKNVCLKIRHFFTILFKNRSSFWCCFFPYIFRNIHSF